MLGLFYEVEHQAHNVVRALEHVVTAIDARGSRDHAERVVDGFLDQRQRVLLGVDVRALRQMLAGERLARLQVAIV